MFIFWFVLIWRGLGYKWKHCGFMSSKDFLCSIVLYCIKCLYTFPAEIKCEELFSAKQCWKYTNKLRCEDHSRIKTTAQFVSVHIGFCSNAWNLQINQWLLLCLEASKNDTFGTQHFKILSETAEKKLNALTSELFCIVQFLYQRTCWSSPRENISLVERMKYVIEFHCDIGLLNLGRYKAEWPEVVAL